MRKAWLKTIVAIMVFLHAEMTAAQEPSATSECTQEDILDCLAPLVLGQSAVIPSNDDNTPELPRRPHVLDLDYRVVKVVYFASTRQIVNPSAVTSRTRLDRLYSVDQDGSLSVGRAKVSWLQGTESSSGGVIWRRTADRDFRIAKAKVIIANPNWDAGRTADEAWKLIAQETNVESGDAVSLLVHGYNTSMEESVAFAGLWATDTEAPGPVVLLSWPSETLEIARQRVKYLGAQGRGRRTAAPLLSALIERAVLNQYRPFLLAHSMGSYVLVNAIQDAPATLQAGLSLVLLTAADLGLASFVDRITGDRLLFGNRYVVYCSDADAALDQSKSYDVVQGHRLGDCSSGLHSLPGNAVLVLVKKDPLVLNDTGDLGHGYHLSKGSVVQHMKSVIKGFPSIDQVNRRVP